MGIQGQVGVATWIAAAIARFLLGPRPLHREESAFGWMSYFLAGAKADISLFLVAALVDGIREAAKSVSHLSPNLSRSTTASKARPSISLREDPMDRFHSAMERKRYPLRNNVQWGAVVRLVC